MNKKWFGLKVVLYLTIFVPSFSFGETPLCYRELELNFFKPSLVNEALSMHSISQSNWTLINMELQKAVSHVPEMIKARAQKMNPNPFSTPFQPTVASELLRQALFDVFSRTLAIFHITNQNKVEEMFQYIRERQSQRFLSCLNET